jgi:hypothetical protein
MDQPQFGAIVLHMGRMCRFLGAGRYEPVETSLEKQRGIEPGEMTAGMRAALDALNRETR